MRISVEAEEEPRSPLHFFLCLQSLSLHQQLQLCQGLLAPDWLKFPQTNRAVQSVHMFVRQRASALCPLLALRWALEAWLLVVPSPVAHLRIGTGRSLMAWQLLRWLAGQLEPPPLQSQCP